MRPMRLALLCILALALLLSGQAEGINTDELKVEGRMFMDEELAMMAPEKAVALLQEAGLPVEKELALSLLADPEKPCTVLDILIALGLGEFQEEEAVFTPVSHVVYAFDCEIFEVEFMYTDFLRGIQMIVPDVEITDVQEDISGMTDEMDFDKEIPTDGRRSFSFRCNGHFYEKELDSRGDWFNEQALEFMEEVLAKENCPRKLQVLNAFAIQGVILFYADDETAARVMELVGAEEF